MAIKVFCDAADLASMLQLAKNPRISGYTTNPTLMRKAGVTDYRAFAKAALEAVTDKPISFEVLADDFATMEKQALEISTWAKNVYVKIPVTNTRRESAAGLVKRLAQAGVKVNVTACFTAEQVKAVAQALAGGPPSVVSVFAGRIADSGRDPKPHMAEALKICRAADKNIELLWASPREVLNVVEAEQVGCDIITATPDLLSKLSLIGKSLDDFSQETVEMFFRDATGAGYKL